ncbi:carboxypeptidase regulatory-like domain-containing protein [Streptomyces ferrugineus]|uniref:Carboxypeptidase regulatory-like domain-containing protein n=1 Tax=Streptomyces ferrugineus TaxID=1413221 RepID=A0A7M2SL21_9ACTN|nr:carboxypeptidase regulatory-like domain-containing protein [Streptomyces ferrugineus]QOV36972.1 carboxypeptidase regulatory-like domain-containing protein [Streptomyces ferrugineus]
MSRSRGCWRTTVLGALAAAGALVVPGMPGAAAYGVQGTSAPVGGDLWAYATIEPGREGVVQVGGYDGEPLGAGSALTLTAPARTKVTGVPFTGLGYRGSVTAGGASATYTFEGAAAPREEPPAAWKGRTFPFHLSVLPDAEPGTRLPDCTLALRDAKGAVRQRGTCTVTVGLPAPVLSRPASGVPLDALPETSGTAYPGAQVTVLDALEEEVCATAAAPDGTWSCAPARALPPGVGRLQATATLNGVSATSEQIDIMVTGPAAPQ